MPTDELIPNKLTPLQESDLQPSTTSVMPEVADFDMVSVFGAFAIVVGTVLVAFSAPALLVSGTLLIVLGTTVPLLWQTYGSISPPISQAARMLLNDDISDLVLTNANSKARELNSNCDEVRLALKHWLDSGQTQGTERVRSLFYSFAAFYPGQMENLVQGNYRGTLLPMYVEAGWKYLTLMRCFYDYAETLKLSNLSFLAPKALVLDYITRYTIIFCNTASESYSFGLSSIRKNHENPELGERRPTWLDYNEYRNVMTLTALDLLATFIYLNPELYSGSMKTATLNRKLLTCVITEKKDHVWRDKMHHYRLNDFEIEHNQTSPIYLLDRLYFATVKTFMNDIEIDGLTYLKCAVRSMDGFERTLELPHTGKIFLGEKVDWQNLHDPIFRIEADYRTGKGSNNATNTAMRLITKLHVYSENYNSVAERNLTFSSTPSEQSSFVDSIPIIPATEELPDPCQHTHYLGAWKMAHLGSVDNPAFVSTWHLKDSNFRQCKPLVAIAETQIQLHQFFAVKAAGSVWDSRANVIPGGHFHGGDLASLPAGGELRFKITDLQTWPSGFYAVRIWYFRSTLPRNVSISIIPPNSFVSSRVSAEIPPATRTADYIDPAFEDLVHFSFPASSRLLLVPAMGSAELRVSNTTLGLTLVIDRIELLFDSTASYQVSEDMDGISASSS